MKALEARYHPTGEAHSFHVVGHVLCDGPRFIVQLVEHLPSPPLRPSVLSSLKYIVAMSARRPFEFLRTIDNRFWSFVEVSGVWNHEDILSEPPSRR